jgi:hypothetical protein
MNLPYSGGRALTVLLLTREYFPLFDKVNKTEKGKCYNLRSLNHIIIFQIVNFC